jgi:hypothetical protein
MVRVPDSWVRAGAFNQLAGSNPVRGLVRQPSQVPALGSYGQRVTGLPLQPAQAQVIIASSTGTVTLGPQGLGNVWYPTQVTVSTTSGVLDTSTFQLYLGAANIPINLVGTLSPGGAGTIALAIPSMSPGQYLTGVWTGANNGDTAAMNVIGTMTALVAA